jgi:hypothetical protein
MFDASGANWTPAVLFHYQAFHEQHLRLTIVHHQIWASDPKTFNDPWDCSPHLHRESLDDEQSRQRYFEYFYQLVREKCATDDEARKRASYFLRPEHRQKFIELASAKLIESHRNTRVFCLSARHDSALMWGHYAANHTGVCLGFSAASEVFRRAVGVRYAVAYPTIDPVGQTPEELAGCILAVKSQDWAYEEEYRLLISENDATPGTLACSDGLMTIPKTDLLIVILGCRMSDEAQAKVRDLVAQRSSPARILKAKKAPDRYELEFVEYSET